MANPYAGLWGDVSGGSSSTAPDNPYSGLWGDPVLSLLDQQEEERRRKREQLLAARAASAAAPEPGLGATPDPYAQLTSHTVDEQILPRMKGGVDFLAHLPENALRGIAAIPYAADSLGRAGENRAALARAQQMTADTGDPAFVASALARQDQPPPAPPAEPVTIPPLLEATFQNARDEREAARQKLLQHEVAIGAGPVRAALADTSAEALGTVLDPTNLLTAGEISRLAGVTEKGLPGLAARLGRVPEDALPAARPPAWLLGDQTPEELAAAARRAKILPEIPVNSAVDVVRPGATLDALQPESSILQVGRHADDLSQDVALGLRARPQDAADAAELARQSLGIHPETSPGMVGGGSPPARGLVVAGLGEDGKIFYGQPGDLHFNLLDRYPEQYPWRNLGGFAGPDGRFLSREEALAVADVPVRQTPSMEGVGLDAGDYADAARRAGRTLAEQRPGEAGFVTNPWAPKSDLYRQTYQIRHDFVTEQNAAVRDSAVRSSALQAAIPSRAAREDMTAVFHGTGNPAVKGDSPQAAAARLAASPYAADAQAAIAAWRQRSDELFQMAKDAGAEDLGYFKDYLHMVYEPPAGEKAIRGSSFSEGPTTSVMRERHFENPAQAMAMGYTPRSLDFSVLMHETERAHAHTRALLGLMDDIGEVNERALAAGLQDAPIVRAGVNPDPKSYVRVEGFPILDRAAPGRVDLEAVQMARKLQAEAGQANAAVDAQRFQPSLPGLEDLGPRRVEAPGIPETPPNIYVHRDLWRNLLPIMEHADANGFDKALSVVKRINFLGSLFHGASLTEAAMDTLGPARGLYEGARRGFGIPGVSQIAARFGGGRVSEDAVQEAIRAGVNVEPPKLDMMKGTFEGFLQQWEGALRKGGSSPLAPRNAVAKALSGFRGAAAMYDEALWKNYHAPLKVTAYHVLLDRVRSNPSRAVARDLASGALTQDELAQSVARHVNSAFGGQNWELLQNDLASNPTAIRWARRVMLSPDWNYSAIETGLSPLSADPVRRQLGRTYYKNAAKLMLGWNALNYALTGHAMWNNEPGHKWDLETGLHDEKGRKLFYQVSKHAGETPDFLLGRDRAGEHVLPIVGSIPHFLMRKANSPLVGAYTAMSGRSPTGFPGALERAQDEADRQARPLSGFEDSAARLRDLTSGVLPFVAQDPESTVRKMLIPFVEKKGMSLHDGRILFAEALRQNDQQGVEKIRQWLVDNGYDGEAINRALSGAYSGIRAEQKANGPAAPPPGPPQPTNPYEGLWR